MNKIRNHSKELIILTILLAVAVSVVNAAVFVYYPIDITAQWGPRPVYFEDGSNANQPDLSGNIITVTLSDDDEYTSASITVHPSRRGVTRYRDVLRIVNSENRNYYIGFKVNTAFDDDAISVAQLIVRDINPPYTIRQTVNLKNTGTQWIPVMLGANSQFRVDLNFIISSSTGGSDSASIELVYSPQSSESPP